MLNPDGVIYGNTRTSLIGADLNRRWSSPSPTLHPTLYHAKRLIQVLSEEREIALICDLHGHSIKKQVFMYGCRRHQAHWQSKKLNALIKLLPLGMDRKIDEFDIKKCHFRVTKDKEATSRVVFFSQLGIDRSYTLEASLYGPRSDGNTPMLEKDYENIGKTLCGQMITFINRRFFHRKLVQSLQIVHSLKPIPAITSQLPTQILEETEQSDTEAVKSPEREEEKNNFAVEDAINELSGYSLSVSSNSSSEVDTESSQSDDDYRKVNDT